MIQALNKTSLNQSNRDLVVVVCVLGAWEDFVFCLFCEVAASKGNDNLKR